MRSPYMTYRYPDTDLSPSISIASFVRSNDATEVGVEVGVYTADN